MLPDRPTTRAAPWTINDFVLVVLAGIVGVFVASLLVGGVEFGTAIVVALAGQYSGHLLGIVYVLRRHGATLTDLGLDVRPIDGLSIFLGVALQIATALLMAPIASLLDTEGPSQAITEQIPSVTGSWQRAAMVVSVALVAPVVEELMFRGMLLQMIEERRGARWAVFGSAGLFSAFHLFGITTEDFLSQAILLLPALFLVGIVLGRQAQRQGRLGVPIFTHAGFNLVAVIGLLIAPELVG